MASPRLDGVLRHIRLLIGRPAVDERSDGQLLQRFASLRDEAAFEALVRRHGPAVLGVCLRVLRHHQDAEDAFQATFLVLARKAGSIRRGDSVGGWLYRVAFHIAVQAAARRRHTREQPITDMPASDPTTDLERRELRLVLDQELTRLPKKYLSPLVLCYVEGRTHEEAARELGWPKGTVSGRLARARELLRSRLARRGVTLASGSIAALCSESAASAAIGGQLIGATVRAALVFATQKAAGGVVSASAAVMAEGALKAMFATKIKLVAAVTLLVLVAGAGAGVVTHEALAQKQGDAAQPAEPPAAEQANGPEQAVAQRETRTDLFGDPLPEGAIARLGTTRLRHPDGINRVAFLPDGKTLISNGYSIRFWDVATGKLIRHVGQEKRSSMGFSPDGRTLAFVSGDKNQWIIHLWDVSAGKEISQFTGHRDPVQCAAFSPNGKLAPRCATNPAPGCGRRPPESYSTGSAPSPILAATIDTLRSRLIQQKLLLRAKTGLFGCGTLPRAKKSSVSSDTSMSLPAYGSRPMAGC